MIHIHETHVDLKDSHSHIMSHLQFKKVVGLVVNYFPAFQNPTLYSIYS